MASPRDPDEVEQTLVPGAPPAPAPAAAGDTPAQPLASDATVTPEQAGDTPPPGGMAPNGPLVVRVARGQTGKLSVPIRVGPSPVAPPAAPIGTDETQASGVVAAQEPSEATLPTGDSGPGEPEGGAAPPFPFDNAGAPVEPGAQPGADETIPSLRPHGFGAAPPRGAVLPPSDATVEQPVSGAPVFDANATLASETRPGGAEPTDADATQVQRRPGLNVDPNATLPTPAGRTVGAGAPESDGLSGGLSHDTVPTSFAAPSRAPNETGTMVGRFALRGLHASGGLGEVFTARDTELNREVAVKRIKSRYADDPGSRRRFLTEAELTARLDHPGVVPVFGLVNDARGRPVYAMRFIRGETLKDEIDRYHGVAPKGPGAEKTEKTGGAGAKAGDTGAPAAPAAVAREVPRTVAFRKLLSRFVYVCQAIAYAHEKGIIHRDIKPANVMVGGFGEVLVVDWGLAKSLSDGPDFDRVMRAQADGGFRHDPEATDLPSHMTMAGTAVGTPSYMPPEQAAGELDKVGPRADVYSLGATLFAILTGRAPFVGKSPTETLEQVRRGAFDPPAVVKADCPKPLSAVCQKAMALRQEDRYATAQELAADVERWLSDEPVSAYRDPPLARLARWSRRHPARVATGVSLLLAGVLAAGGITWAVYQGEQKAIHERNEADKARRETEIAYAALGEEQKKTLQESEEVKRQKALVDLESARVTVARNLARERYKRAVATYNTLIRDLDKKLSDRENMQATRERLLLDATEGLKKLVEGKAEGEAGADSTLVAAYRQMGEVYQIIGKTDLAKKQFARSVEMAEAVKKEADAPAGGRTPEVRAAEMRE
ncbi:MAG TPA: protein kinase, partial [Gemmata sp.]